MESLLARDMLTAQIWSCFITRNRTLGETEEIKGYLIFNVVENSSEGEIWFRYKVKDAVERGPDARAKSCELTSFLEG
jgi:hypothetical protein